MRLKTKLVLAISGLVFTVVLILSWLWLGQLLQHYIQQSLSFTDSQAREVLLEVQTALDTGLRQRQFNAQNPAAVQQAVTETLQQDAGLNALLTSIENSSLTVLDVAVADKNSRVLVDPDISLEGQILPQHPEYATLRRQSLISILRVVFGPARTYNVTRGLDLNGKPFLTVRISISTTFLRSALHPWLVESFTFIGLAMLISVVAAAFLANLALQPIEQISRRLDMLAAQETAAEDMRDPSRPPDPSPPEAPVAAESRGGDEVARVSGKIERLGQRIRNVEEVFSALRENLDQILSNLQDGVMLFTRDARAVLVSSSVERFLSLDRNRIFGAEVREIFDRGTRLGRTVRDAFDSGMSIVQEEVTTETGRRVEVSLDFIHDTHSLGRNALGALLTLHDLESVREIESELEVSRRMAAIGRLTAGVGHEVRNPINAIVVHLELLRNKVHAGDDAMRHLDVIQSEIRRLDRVVQTLVDFSRPVELQLRDQDLRGVVSRVLLLASAELQTRNIVVESQAPPRPVLSRVDADLIEQALLNVVLNGAQAMASGGTLEVRLQEDTRWASILIRDHGVGISDEIRARIFDLYFTTKKEGSGIGLAMTYRILQMHHGQIDVESKPGSGTTFVLRLPLIMAAPGQRVPADGADATVAGEIAHRGQSEAERSGA